VRDFQALAVIEAVVDANAAIGAQSRVGAYAGRRHQHWVEHVVAYVVGLNDLSWVEEVVVVPSKPRTVLSPLDLLTAKGAVGTAAFERDREIRLSACAGTREHDARDRQHRHQTRSLPAA
jgi:hypothetical protein